MNHQHLLSFLLASLAFSVLSRAEVAMTPLTSFAGDGWLAPLEVNWLSDTGATERSIAYSPSPNHLYVSSRNGGNRIRILNGTTGAEVNAANGGVTMPEPAELTGTLGISAVDVARDGILYACNLCNPVTESVPFKIYRWIDFDSQPAVVFNSGTITAGRMGDTLDVTGGGTITTLATGESNSTGTGDRNGFAIFNITNGPELLGFLVDFPPPGPKVVTPAPGDFQAGMTFNGADSVIGSQGIGGFKFTRFSGRTGMVEQAKVLTNTSERPMDFIVLGGKPLLATIETNGNTATPQATFNTVRVYDVADPANPFLVASGRTANTWRTQGSSGGGTGSVRWGAVTGNSARLYALSTNNGIQAFTVTVGAAKPLVFSTIHLDNAAGTLTVAWNSATGTTYRVEASTNLVDWTPVATAIPADPDGTNDYVWTIPTPSTSRAQLRVVRE